MGSTFNLALLTGGIFQTALIALLLWRKRTHSAPALTFIILNAAYTAQTILQCLDQSGIDPESTWSLKAIGDAMPLALCPLSFLYVKYSLSPTRFSIIDPVYFFPFIYYAAVVILFHTTHHYFATLLPDAMADLFIQLVIFIFFLLMSIRFISKDRNFTKASKIWLEEFTFAVFVTNFMIIASFKSMLFLYPDYQEIRYLFFALPVLIYWLTFRELTNKKPSTHKAELPDNTAYQEDKYKHSNLSNHYAIEIQGKLINLMEVDRAFTEPGLTLDAVSSRINIPRHHVTQVLNERFQKTFTDFVNAYRIELATQMIMDPKYSHLTMAAIGFDCGFNSISTFNLAFKKFRNTSPAAFRKKQEAINKLVTAEGKAR